MNDIYLCSQPCPGPLVNYPSSTACRVSALGNGTVIEQTVTPSNLCDPGDIHSFLLGIARKYRVGDGQVSCCYTSGCNIDIVTARGSFESQDIPSRPEAFKKQSLLTVSQNIKQYLVIFIVNHLGGGSGEPQKWNSVDVNGYILDNLVL